MNYKRAVAEFLAQPENLPVALEVAKRVEEAKDRLQIQFWQQYRDEMECRLRGTDAAQRWKIHLLPEKMLLDPWAQCRIEYRPPHERALHLDVNLEAGRPRHDCNLYYGLRWSQNQKNVPALHEVAELELTLKAQGYTVNSSAWWLMVCNLDHRLRADNFLIRFAAEPQQVVNELSDIVWAFFEQTRTSLEAINEALGADDPSVRTPGATWPATS